MSFASLGLSEPLLRAVSAAAYTTPTPIQLQAIPPIAAGRDLLGCAQTGTGKTAAFAMPLIEQLHQTRRAAAGRQDAGRNGQLRVPRVLVLAPTRELAVQIDESFRKYAKRTKLRSVVIYGGVSQRPQTVALERGVDIIVATPGRLLDLIKQGFVDLSYIQSVVLDEADHMLDMGFLPDVRRILDKLPNERQTLLFSATMPAAIRSLAEANMVDPVRVTIKPDKSNALKIEQSVYFLAPGAKLGFLIKFLQSQPGGTTLVFSRTKHNANNVVRQLDKAGIRAAAIHSDKSQNNRQRTLKAFQAGQVDVLVATDIAARGIDVRGITYVLNYDLPDVAETYTHRIGRTGRAGQPGIAITLCDATQKKNLRLLEKHLGFRLVEGDRLPDVPKVDRQGVREIDQLATDESPAQTPRHPHRDGGRVRQRASGPSSGNRSQRQRQKVNAGLPQAVAGGESASVDRGGEKPFKKRRKKHGGIKSKRLGRKSSNAKLSKSRPATG